MNHILITGAASGIGRAAAKRLAAAPAHLTLIDRDQAGLDELSAELGAQKISAVAMDVSDPAVWAALGLTPKTFTGAVLCAGVSDAAAITDMTFQAWRKVMSVNLDGAFLAMRYVLKNAVDGASIVAVSSATARKPSTMTAAYGASKAGLSQLVKVAALEAAPRGIRVNAVAPGGVKTPMFSAQPVFEDLIAAHGDEDGAWAALAEATPLGRFAEPDEIAAAIAFLLSADAATITGTILDCDGGYGL